MAKKVTKRKPKPKLQTFPPKFSTAGVRITGFRVEIDPYTPPAAYEDKKK
jgi:hypothetical protein